MAEFPAALGLHGEEWGFKVAHFELAGWDEEDEEKNPFDGPVETRELA
jgi:hypothetical protein